MVRTCGLQARKLSLIGYFSAAGTATLHKLIETILEWLALCFRGLPICRLPYTPAENIWQMLAIGPAETASREHDSDGQPCDDPCDAVTPVRREASGQLVAQVGLLLLPVVVQIHDDKILLGWKSEKVKHSSYRLSSQKLDKISFWPPQTQRVTESVWISVRETRRGRRAAARRVDGVLDRC